MRKIVIPETLWPLVVHRDPAGRESAGIAIASAAGDGDQLRFLVREVHIPDADGYIERDAIRASLTPDFVARVISNARNAESSVVFFHTHPAADRATFSPTDDRGEVDLMAFLRRRIPDQPHAAMVLGTHGHSARLLGTLAECEIEVVGRTVRQWKSDPAHEGVTRLKEFDRQVRVFGASAQRRLATLQVAIVGLGGTGSIVAQELAHLGVNRFVLIDPDVVDSSNLSRIVGAIPADADRTAKVDVARRLITGINPAANISTRIASVLSQPEATAVSMADVVFCCTDNHGSRFALNQIAYQFYIPVFDIGVAIVARDAVVTHVFGRVQLLAPGMPCLTCLRMLDPHQIRRDLMSESERQGDPYFVGDGEPQPAVISLNGVVSSMAITMLLGVYAGVPADSRYQMYDAMRGVVRSLAATPVHDCVTCSIKGLLGRGDSRPLPGLSA